MTIDIILMNLRSRLAIVSREITRLDGIKRPNPQQFLIDAGKS